ncbi:MAG: ribokinase [Caulobacterales bacterium]
MSVCVFGSLNLDIVIRVEEIPRPGETIFGNSVTHHTGGKGANQAIAAARLGATTRMFGKVGSDEAGRRLLSALKSDGVDCTGIAIDNLSPSGKAYILVSQRGENVIVVSSGANSHATADSNFIGDVFLCQFESPRAALNTFLKSSASRNSTRLLNAAPAIPAWRDLLAHCDVLIVNQHELAAYTDLNSKTPDNTELLAKAAAHLLCGDCKAVIVTLGEQGALLVEPDSIRLAPARKTHVVDTTGAGDCFCGALAAGIDRGLSLFEALSDATLAASLSVERHGAAASMPTALELKQLYASLN